MWIKQKLMFRDYFQYLFYYRVHVQCRVASDCDNLYVTTHVQRHPTHCSVTMSKGSILNAHHRHGNPVSDSEFSDWFDCDGRLVKVAAMKEALFHCESQVS